MCESELYFSREVLWVSIFKAKLLEDNLYCGASQLVQVSVPSPWEGHYSIRNYQGRLYPEQRPIGIPTVSRCGVGLFRAQRCPGFVVGSPTLLQPGFHLLSAFPSDLSVGTQVPGQSPHPILPHPTRDFSGHSPLGLSDDLGHLRIFLFPQLSQHS